MKFWTKKKNIEPVIERPKFATPQDLVNFVLIECSDFEGEEITFKYNHTLYLKNVKNISLERIVMLNDLLKQEFNKKIDELDFEKCKDLELPNGLLEKLPLYSIHLNGCKITKLPNFHNLKDLRFLSLFDCGISSLPRLPESLIHLTLSYNEFETLDELPSKLKNLSISNNKLVKLPMLPDTLTTLCVEKNQLKKLPYLPTSLKDLDCAHNKLSDISIPTRLESLHCNGNDLTELEHLPKTLKNLFCWDNKIEVKPNIPWIDNDHYLFTREELTASCDRDRAKRLTTL